MLCFLSVFGSLNATYQNFYPEISVLQNHNQEKSHSVLFNLPSKSKIDKWTKRLQQPCSQKQVDIITYQTLQSKFRCYGTEKQEGNHKRTWNSRWLEYYLREGKVFFIW